MKRSVVAKAPRARAWRAVSDIAGLPKWVVGAKKCTLRAGARRGIGAVREIVFDDGSRVEEHIVAWKGAESFSYVAVSGLPLQVYVATISLAGGGAGATRITWQSYMASGKMTGGQFARFLASMGAFYGGSLGNLKALLEGGKRSDPV